MLGNYGVCMKSLKIIFILIFVSEVYSQTTALDSALALYPLQTGNYWEFEVNSSYSPYGPFTPLYSLEVIGDTTMSNNNIYRVIKLTYFGSGRERFRYERIDSLTACVYKYDPDLGDEYKADSLLAKPGDYITASRFRPLSPEEREDFGLICEDYYTRQIFDKVRYVKEFTDYGQHPSQLRRFAEGLGIIYTWIWEINFWIERVNYAVIDGVEYGIKTSVEDDSEIGYSLELSDNYPNPFNPSTKLSFTLPKRMKVELIIYNLIGEQVKILFSGIAERGKHSVQFNAENLSSGTYFYQLITNENQITKKMLFLK